MAQYDVILFGATGFTGSLALDYLLTKPNLKFAICGRNREKLQRRIEGAASKPDVYVLDVTADSQTDIQEVVKKTKCVATAVGPFVEFGEPLVQACATLGVDYVDTSGESTFLRQMIEKYDALAKQTGARIVVHCGMDCVPWDLMVWKLWKHVGNDMTGVKLFNEQKGRPSCGTLTTALLNMRMKSSKSDVDPLYMVAGEKSECSTKVTLPKGGQFYEEMGAKGGPWIMGPVMANAVKRTNSVLKMVPNLQYTEAMLESSDVGVTTMLTVAMGTCMYLPSMQGLWQSLGVIPQAGTGPTDEEMEQGYLTLTGFALTEAKSPKCKAVMKFYKDPGYRDTARMFVEAALSLVDTPKAEKAGGLFSPAAACAERLFDRLTAGGTMWELTEL